jgi:hypothetical protein
LINPLLEKSIGTLNPSIALKPIFAKIKGNAKKPIIAITGINSPTT